MVPNAVPSFVETEPGVWTSPDIPREVGGVEQDRLDYS